jgi:hypothetical protein
MRLASLIFLFLSAYAGAQQSGVSQSPYAAQQRSNPLNNFVLRLGLPVFTHGPGFDIGDVTPSFIRTGTNSFYQYGANQCSWGSAVSSLTQNTGTGGGTGKNSCTSPGVMDTIKSNLTLSFAPNSIVPISPAVNSDFCGDWVESFTKIGSTYYAFVHNEGPCNYTIMGQSNLSVSMWTSSTGAPASWSPMAVEGVSPGTIISSQEPPEATFLTGFGDGSMFPSPDGKWLYAYLAFYCDSSICDYHNAVARAPANAPGPGNWSFLYQGCFCAPALNNPYNATLKLPNADLFKWVGANVATMPGTPYTAISVDGKDHTFNIPTLENYNGLAVSIALDYVHFTTLHSPIINFDFQNFGGRPTPDDLYVYSTLLDGTSGSNVLSNPANMALWSLYVPPNNSLNSRYLVQYPVTMTRLTTAQRLSGIPQVAISLETYQNTSTGQIYSGHRRSTTVNPSAGISSDGATETGWAPAGFLGYILTACPYSVTINACDANGARIANRIEECWSGAAADDYQLHIDTGGTAGSCPSGWTHVRTVGWLFQNAQAFGTTAIYACSLTATGTHFSSVSQTCNGQTFIALLGYAASN